MLFAVAGAALLVLVSCTSDGDAGATSDGEECATSVHVFVELGTSQQRERRIGDVIDTTDGVVDSFFHSRLDAFREFKRLYEDQPEVYEERRPDDFPSRYEVVLDETTDFDSFQRALEGATTGIDRLVPGGCATETPP